MKEDERRLSSNMMLYDSGEGQNLFHAPNSITRALLEYDTQMKPMEWRIKERKLNFVRQIFLSDDSNIAKNTIIQEMSVGINGLGHECDSICNEINLPEITNTSLLKSNIKTAVHQTIDKYAFLQKGG